MASKSPIAGFTLETLIAFAGALLVFPLLIKSVLGITKGLFRLGFVRKLIFESALIGVTTLLTKPEVLDKLFGQRGEQGDGLLKPDVDG